MQLFHLFNVATVLALLALSFGAKGQQNAFLDFALEYRGPCNHTGLSATCRLTGSSQEISTRITADGRVNTTIHRLIGSISQLDLDITYNFNNLTFASHGTLTFGIHQTHHNHVVALDDNGMGRIGYTPFTDYVFATSWKIVKGSGALDQAIGFVTGNGVWQFGNSEAFMGLIGVIYYKGTNQTLHV